MVVDERLSEANKASLHAESFTVSGLWRRLYCSGKQKVSKPASLQFDAYGRLRGPNATATYLVHFLPPTAICSGRQRGAEEKEKILKPDAIDGQTR